MPTDASHPIGVFDSGVGGLTVVRALMERLPFEDIVYFGDTARVPYGIKSVETITGYARQIADFLLHRNVKLLIIACNTMAAVAYDAVAKLSPVPVLDVIDAGAHAAVEATRTKAVGVIGTPATINSNAYARAIHDCDAGIRIFSRACPLFVPLVEEGWHEDEITVLTAKRYLDPMADFDADTLVLGCTHYPVIKDVISRVVGEKVVLVDSAHETAAEVERVLAKRALRSDLDRPGRIAVYVTDIPYLFKEVGERFLRRPMERVERIDLESILVNGSGL
jgi:glutamate racemase